MPHGHAFQNTHGAHRTHPRPIREAAPSLTEVAICEIAAGSIVGYPDAPKLVRAVNNTLDGTRRRMMTDLVARDSAAAGALRDFAGTHAQLRSGASLDELARISADLVKSGLVVIRGGIAACYPGVTISSQTLSSQGLDFLFRHEAKAGVSQTLHHPTRDSGVTLGAGYDMKRRSETQITSDLVSVGVDPRVAQEIGKASTLTHQYADDFVRNYKGDISLSDEQQLLLFQRVAPYYATMAKRGVVPSILPRLFDYEFDALVSYTYNVGHLGGTELARTLASGRFDRVSFHRTGPGLGRVQAEKRVFMAGLYQ